MALSPPVEREHLHTRQYHFEGFRRADGLWDLEGRMTDAKTYGFDNRHRGHIAAEEPIHDMRIRLTIDEDFEVKAVEVATEAGPFAACPGVTPNYRKLEGERIGPGWRNKLRQLFAGTEGCTHHTEMLGAMATVAYQTLYPELTRKKKAPQRSGKPALIDSCYAFSSDGEVVLQNWPEFYTGDEAKAGGQETGS